MWKEIVGGITRREINFTFFMGIYGTGSMNYLFCVGNYCNFISFSVVSETNAL